jgi:hypothetical protein
MKVDYPLLAVSLVLAVILFCCCTKIPPDLEPEETPYFTMNCWRGAIHSEKIHWYCYAEPQTELIAGDISMNYDGDKERLLFCAQGATLNSDNEYADNLVSILDDRCVALPPAFGEFGWEWNGTDALEIYWSDTKKMILFLPGNEEYTILEGKVYYYEE